MHDRDLIQIVDDNEAMCSSLEFRLGVTEREATRWK